MNRKIKFRVWDTEEDRFTNQQARPSNVCTFGDDGNTYELTDDGGVRPTALGRYIVQEFTGVKDKNGREIYEGDILQLKRGTVYIRYNPERACYQYLASLNTDDYRADMHFLDEPVGGDSTVRTGKINESKLEVIGNILENPGLLTR
jgi:uncharacterized phage protein (TIGR01671 family)